MRTHTARSTIARAEASLRLMPTVSQAHSCCRYSAQCGTHLQKGGGLARVDRVVYACPVLTLPVMRRRFGLTATSGLALHRGTRLTTPRELLVVDRKSQPRRLLAVVAQHLRSCASHLINHSLPLRAFLRRVSGCVLVAAAGQPTHCLPHCATQ
jgi:hypothetical protein